MFQFRSLFSVLTLSFFIATSAEAASGRGSVFYKLDQDTVVPAFFMPANVAEFDEHLVAIGKVSSIECQEKTVLYGQASVAEKWALVRLDLEEVIIWNRTLGNSGQLSSVNIIKRGCLMRGEDGEVDGYDGPPPGQIFKRGDRILVVLESVSAMSEKDLASGFPQDVHEDWYRLHVSYFLPSRAYPSNSPFYSLDDRYSDASPLLEMDFARFRFGHPFDLAKGKEPFAGNSKKGYAEAADLDAWSDRPLIAISELPQFQNSNSGSVRTDLGAFRRYSRWLLVEDGHENMLRKIHALRDSVLTPNGARHGDF